MKVILLQDVRKLGKKGDIVKVADGYGQNYLIKNKLAVLETNATRKVVENEKQLAHEEDLKRQDDAKQLAKRLEDITLEFSLKSGKDGKTFGSVSTKQIVEQLREKYDIKIDKRKFIDAHPIGALGYTKLKVDLYKGIIATITVHLKEQ
ncbi:MULTISPECIES: 50S ribosomal protein L9 [unclassified Thomasclavelia]|uniref:Large ribosomal subunit protein bL9 n=1 Tax=Candidatus Erysipelatoclostridium merdavium TaxID=2838566 RepID=A0A9D1XNA5_9FIRM|nr:MULTISPECIES: 50S ribosomal protein L9 [unclassified Thomasclavelia]OUP77518.1 50S ribosomal protein L9 [Erysipelatoclostridium sp. An173]OUQ09063.1 50S ribosomal protein L9 [Erysipelatoclostridium sp. An15]HIX82351.1 50S ribosomal protein L9 [Candidatus Erysipelatoclostridium merdavium]